MTGPVPVAHPPACQDTDNDLDDERPMDEDECLDYADQEPLPFPTSTGELGLMAQSERRIKAGPPRRKNKNKNVFGCKCL
jgi:hypothetical protein